MHCSVIYGIWQKRSHWFEGRWWSSSLYGSITSPRTPCLRTAALARSSTQLIEGRLSSSHLNQWTTVVNQKKKKSICDSRTQRRSKLINALTNRVLHMPYVVYDLITELRLSNSQEDHATIFWQGNDDRLLRSLIHTVKRWIKIQVTSKFSGGMYSTSHKSHEVTQPLLSWSCAVSHTHDTHICSVYL